MSFFVYPFSVMKKALVLFLLSLLYVNAFSQNADIRLLRSINLNRNTNLDPVFRGLSYSVAPLGIGVPVGIFCIASVKHDSLLQRNSLVIGASVFSAGLLTIALKEIVHRKRPYVS